MSPPVAGQAKTLVIEQFDAEINVLPSGRIHVNEAIRFRFTGSWNGVFRDIPIRYETPPGIQLSPGSRHKLRLGRGWPAWIPGAIDQARTVNIEYSVENALRFIDPEDSDFEAGHDELYWNVTGDEWEIPIQAATARIVVPPEVTGLQARVYTGPVGSSTTNDATSTEIDYGFYFVTAETLAAR